ncbi:MAG: motility protein MotB [Oceanospirillum sp.]|nr:motility protein MotB [Oceanospirillum sp.]
MEENKSIIIKRVKKVQGGHHGGSWKIAMADFAIAMMAFFLLMWLLANTTEAQKIELEKFFVDPVGYMDKVGRLTAIDLGGSPTILNNFNPSSESDQINQEQMLNQEQTEQLAGSIQQDNEQAMSELHSSLLNTIEANETLKKFEDQLQVEVKPDGLHIQIVDQKLRPMFDAGGDKVKHYFAEVLLQLAPVIAQVNNKISVNGHTDADNYSDRDYFSNWELSTRRANAARRMLVEGGLPEDQVAQISGFASSQLFKPDKPNDPINRRIEIVVLNRPALEDIQAERPLSPEQQERMREAEAFKLSNPVPESQFNSDGPLEIQTQESQRKRAESQSGIDGAVRPRKESTFGEEGVVIDRDLRRQPNAEPKDVLDTLNQIQSQPAKPYTPPPEVD